MLTQTSSNITRSFLQFLLVCLIALAASWGFTASKKADGKTGQSAGPKARVRIQVIADSSNSLQANLEVPVGTSARDLMDRLFKMSYVDFTHRFVSGIAGFMANPKEKKYWRLEIDGKASEIGIAEIKISKPVQIRWVIADIM